MRLRSGRALSAIAAGFALVAAGSGCRCSGEPELGRISMGAASKPVPGSAAAADPGAPASASTPAAAAALAVPKREEAVALLVRLLDRVEAGDDRAAAGLLYFAPGTDEEYRLGFVSTHFRLLDRSRALPKLKAASRWGPTAEIAPEDAAPLAAKRKVDPRRCYTLAGDGYRAHFTAEPAGLRFVSWSGPAK